MRGPEMTLVVLIILELFLAVLAFYFVVGRLASTRIFIESVHLGNRFQLLEGANLTHLDIVAF